MWIELSDLFWLALTATLCMAWWQNLKIREHATRQVRAYCQQQDVQLLDESIALKSMKPRRSLHGRLELERCYQFSFTSTGDERYNGQVRLSGRRILGFELQPHRIG
ncbi:DUF3301 domain-containing protein [Marinobacterium sp. MBR-109]|jgi:redox-regulated HSP33 family molecular chaperone|uniref:DUF3301 domain-containing protein n=1 Tax=Marinobacterium sp. MBR-109 TaxID=3156462 RepID=UPI003394A795